MTKVAATGVIKTLQELVRINSVNPAYTGGPGEAAIQNYVEEFLRSRDVQVSRHPVVRGRPNVIARVEGSARNVPRLLFEAHVDTAGVDNMSIDPFQAELENGRLFGRGACDVKAGLAAMLHAIADVRTTHRGRTCDVMLAATIDEEYAFRGVLSLAKRVRYDAAIVAEPTSLRLAVASKGCLRWRTTVVGRMAHSAVPHSGINAIYGASRLVSALEQESVELRRGYAHPLLGTATLSVGRINGGTQVNTVPSSCTLEIDRRLLPGEQPLHVLQTHRKLLKRLHSTDSNFRAEVDEPFLIDYPFETATDTDVCRVAASALQSHGRDMTPIGVPFGSDASKLARGSTPTIILGPGQIEDAHTAQESVSTAEVEEAFLIYRDIMQTYV